MDAVAAALPGLGPLARRAPRVEAVPTVLHGHPEGQTTLVRFVVTGVDAPAARLRVFGTGGRLVGTAGLVRRAETLAGELFVPLTRPITLRTELETPVTRGVHRTSHRLTPTPRWTIRWLTLADSDALRQRLAAVPPLLLGAEVAVLTSAGVRLNPWSAAASGRDHLDLLRIAVPAMRLSAATGIPVSDRALVAEYERAVPQVLAALRGSGISAVVDDVAAVDPQGLGLDAGRARMTPLIEGFLAAQAPPPEGRGTLTLVGTDPEIAIRAIHAVGEWNGRYAYPRLELPAAGSSGSGEDRASSPTGGAGFDTWLRLVVPDEPTLGALARRLALPFPALVVFNPSPFGRSDVVELEDGALRVLTNVPGWGYASAPEGSGEAGGAAGSREPLRPIETGPFQVRLDERTGGIASLVDRSAGTDLVASGGGLDGLDGSAVSDAWVERYPGVGVRLVARRAAPAGGLTTRVTAYDALPWLDIENRWDAAPAAQEWRFDLSHPVTEVIREVAGGTVRAAPPLDRSRFLRWVALRGEDRTVLIATDGPADLSVGPEGRMLLHGGGTRIRVAAHRGFLLPDDPWRFGFGVTPLVAHRAPGSGALRLPTFGRLLDVADPMTALIALKQADDGVGVVAYLMDLGGPPREVPVRPGVLAFEGGVAVDLTERDQRPLSPAPAGGVLIPLETGGYAAARLLGVRVAG
jgi:hypothetical protein